MNLALVTPAAALPVTIPDLMAHVRGGEAEEATLGLYLAAAVQAVQDETGRSLITETWRLSLPAFPTTEVVLPRAPLVAVTEVRYWTTDAIPVDTLLPASVYHVAASAGPTAQQGRFSLADEQSWPEVAPNRSDAVRITYTVGYGATGAAVPAPLRAAVLLTAGDLYENREAQSHKPLTENATVMRLLSPYRLWAL